MQNKKIEQKINKLKISLEKYLLKQNNFYKKISPFGVDLKEKLIPFIISGKGMRGLLVLLSTKKEDMDALNIAMALEFLHSGLLIHDDIMDEDVLRRGKKSIYIQYKESLKEKNTKKDLYGISQAICLGDIAFFVSFNLLSGLKNKNKDKIRAFFSEEMARVGFGQMEDVYFGFSKKEPSEQEIFSIYKSKTARYSVSIPVALGMYLNDEDDKMIKKAISVGESLGVLFQMKDDELGIWGEADNTGKGVFKDILKNKKTFLRKMLLESLSHKEKKETEPLFGKEGLDYAEVKKIIYLLDKYKIKEKHQKLATVFYKKMKKEFATLPVFYKNIFNFIYEYNQNRKK